MTVLIALVLALLPGAVAFATGARLRRLAGDAALAERLLSRRRLVSQVWVVALVLTLFLARDHAAWSLPAMGLLALALGFPTRRALFGDTLELVAYLAQATRWILAGFGFWIALAVAPALASRADWAAGLLALALAAWGAAHAELFAWLVDASPLARADLESGIDDVVRRSRIPRPRLLAAGHPGSRWANAFALPSLARPAVLLTHTLLEAFPADEILAVFAHEVAHLEHHDRRRTRVGFALVLLLVAAASFGVPRLLTLPVWGGHVMLAWPLFLFVALLVRMARHQGHEAESDRRAVELLGDPEPLARALVRLHAMSHLPRRLDPEMERSASHPSLARRLQAIRAQAPLPHEARFEPVVLDTERPGTAVILEADRAHWLEGVPFGASRDVTLRDKAGRVRSVAYTELGALRVHVGWTGRVSLQATDASGRSWKVPLRAAELAAAQAALDGIDARLGAARPSPWLHPVPDALICCALLLAALAAGRVGVFLLPPAGGLLAPTPPLLVASGAGAAIELWRGASAGALPFAPSEAARWSLPGLALAALLVGAWKGRRPSPWNAPTTVVATLLGLLGAASSAGLLLAALHEPRLARVHVVAAERPGAAVAFVALASMLLVARRLTWAAALGAVGALPLLAASQAAARLSEDPLLRTAPVLRTTERRLGEIASVRLEASASDVRLAPDASVWAVREHGAEAEEPAIRFRVGRFSGTSRLVDALDVAFLRDERLLRLRDGGGRSVLEATGLMDDEPTWRLELPSFAGSTLELAGDGLDWLVTGWSFDERGLLIASGRVGEATVSLRPSRTASGVGSTSQQVAGARETLVLRWQARLAPFAVVAALSGTPLTTVELLWSAAGGERSIARTPGQVRCIPRRAAADFVCATSQAGRTRFFRLPEGGSRFAPLGTLEARTWREQLGADGRLYAWAENGRFVELDFDAGEARRLVFGNGRRVHALGLAPGFAAALGADEAGSSVLSLHRLP
ncbi:MAG TPA: M48 family metalloprotease [Vicinamibacteria bacterium]|nr:M48 family metalloprotease [Vicinamibacteria bacterium]